MCKKLHVIKEHTGAVNQIKTVYTKLAHTEAQLLYSCGDDGLINVQNLDNIGKSEKDLEETENLVKTRRAKPQMPKDPLFLFSLSGIEYTGLKKNKKIGTIDFSNKRGLLFAGCYGGDLCVWRNDNYRRDKFMKEAYELVSKIKVHGQILHMISVSPDDNFFMTGATDGKAIIWRPPETILDINELIGEVETDRKAGTHKSKSWFKKHLVSTIDGSSEFSICQCDSIQWSWRGSYAVVAFGGKDQDSNNDKSVIYVWDQQKEKVIHKLGSKESGISLENFTLVLECHPKDENFFISSGGSGKVLFWDLRAGKILKTFTEYGLYHRDQNIIDEVFDGKFSKWGNYFAVTTIWGTFTIYSVFSNEPYLSVPIEQFFHLDKHADMVNDIYNRINPVLWDFERLKYPEQPPLPILGER